MQPIRRIFCFVAWGCAILASLFWTEPVSATDTKSPAPYDWSVQVLGAVHYPGWYPISSESTVTELIKRAGGLTSDAAPVMGVIRKSEKKGFIVSFNDPTFHLQDGDELRVLRTRLP